MEESGYAEVEPDKVAIYDCSVAHRSKAIEKLRSKLEEAFAQCEKPYPQYKNLWDYYRKARK